MANKEHIKKFLEGAEKWNQWKGSLNEDTFLDLSKFDFSKHPERFDTEGVESNKFYYWDFSHVDLSGSDFNGLKLDYCDFSNAILDSANFDDAILFMAQIYTIHLYGASFKNTNLNRATFSSELDFSMRPQHNSILHAYQQSAYKTVI